MVAAGRANGTGRGREGSGVIARDNLIPELLKRAAALPQGHALEVRSYKRDRGFLLVRESESRYWVVEDGFHHERLCLPCDDLKRHLRGVVKREFPRSHKLRLYELGRYAPSAEWPGRKVL